LIKLVERLLSHELRHAILSSQGDAAVWLVGGAVRDHFLNRPHPDLDFAVAGEARELARAVADRLEGAYFSLDDDRDAGRVILQSGARTLDFIRLQGDSIEHDLRQRDYTINALALSLSHSDALIDVQGGLQDLKDGRLRACGPDSIASDPVRALRGVRLATQLKLQIEPETQKQIRNAAGSLPGASVERLRDEFARMLQPDLASSALRLLHTFGSLQMLIPEFEANGDMQDGAFSTVDRLRELLAAVSISSRAQNLTMAEVALKLTNMREKIQRHLEREVAGGHHASQMLILAGLLSGIEQPEIRRRVSSLRFSRKESRRVQLIVRSASDLRSGDTTRNDVQAYRLFRSAGELGVEAALLYLASFLAQEAGPPEQDSWRQRVDWARSLMEIWFENRLEILQPPTLLRGDELAGELGVPTGPLIGELLESVREAQVAGEISTAGEALQLAQRLLAERA
jgi:tRNA nucleotidyltransferase/poly(A) polymerase